MTNGARKRPSDGIAGAPVKKPRATEGSPTRRSSRAGKGVGGAGEQLRRAGEAIAPGLRKRSDLFAGEACNPMAPESQQESTERVSDFVSRFNSVQHSFGC